MKKHNSSSNTSIDYINYAKPIHRGRLTCKREAMTLRREINCKPKENITGLVIC